MSDRRMGIKLNWGELCRACLRKCNENEIESLLTDSPERENIYNMYAALTNIQVDVKETSPSQFCYNCKEKLIESFNFRKMCLESDEHFRTYKEEMERELEEQSSEYCQQNDDEDVEDDSEVQLSSSVEFSFQEVVKEIGRIRKRFDTMKRCIICPDIYSCDLPNKGLILHMVHAHKNITNWCSNCNLLIDGNFDEHKKSHQKDNGKCKFCGKIYKNISRLYPHVKSHLVPSVVCEICETAFLKKEFRNCHMLLKHARGSRFGGGSDNKIADATGAEMISSIDHAYVKQDPENDAVDQSELVIKCDELDDSEVIIIYNPYSTEGDDTGITNDNTEGVNLDHSLAVDIWKAIQDLQLNRNPHTACIFCSENTDNHRDLVEHVKEVHSDVENWCSACNELIEKNYRNHIKEHDEEEIECQFCQEFISQNEYLKHLGEHFGSVVKLALPDENEGDTDATENNENGVNVKPHLCSTCGSAFWHKSSLKRHTTKVHANQYKISSEEFEEFQSQSKKLCKECNEYVDNLEEHLLEHEVEGMLLCDLCGDVFKLGSTLKTHIVEKHGCNENQSVYKCQFCNKEFKTKRQLGLHKKLHVLDRNHICSICGKGFKTTGNLTNHIATHERKFSCKVCQKRYGTRSELRIHLMKHTGEKPFLCSECGAGFTQHCHLVDHSRTHTGELPFVCLQCGRGFKRKHTMKIHIMSHSGVKKLSCPCCSYACNRRYHLKMHMKTHMKAHTRRLALSRDPASWKKFTDVKFFCRICEKRFFSKSSLQVHMTSAHNVIFKISEKVPK